MDLDENAVFEPGDVMCWRCRTYVVGDAVNDMNDVRLENKKQDRRRMLVLSRHLSTNPVTIKQRTTINIARWNTPTSPERAVQVGKWLRNVRKTNPRRLESLERQSRSEEVKKAVSDVLFLAHDNLDARRMLVLPLLRPTTS